MIKNTENNNGKVVVLFEVTPTAEGKARYLELAAQLKLLLSDAKGFIRSERFSSLNEEGKLLSLNVWENEEAVEKWRNELHHRMSQSEGRERLFENYRITVTHSFIVHLSAGTLEFGIAAFDLTKIGCHSKPP